MGYEGVEVNVGDDDDIPLDASYDPTYPFGESPSNFDDSFWEQVKVENGREGINRVTALRIVRVRKLQEQCDGDLLVHLITTKHDQYLVWCQLHRDLDSFATFVYELSELAAVILDADFASESPRYVGLLLLEDDTRANIIHLAAERNLVEIMKKVVEFRKNVAAATTNPGDMYPLHFALEKYHDEAAALLITAMANHKVRELFEGNAVEGPRFQFADLITHGAMKKSVDAVLDCLMNPDWPFIPQPKDDDEEGLVIPNMPFRYHFYYRVLDGDDEGLPGRLEDGTRNADFNVNKTKSCLRLLADYSSSEDATLRHPVVRMLMRNKWNSFGKRYITMSLFVYALFLALLSVALLTDSSTPDRLQYSTSLDYLRGVCEIATLIITLYFVIAEIDEMVKEQLGYLSDVYNYMDILGLGLIIAIVPLRFSRCMTAEFAVSAAAYLINFMRISKCSTAFKSMSIYSKTFASVITQEISRFALLFSIFMLSFTGCVYLSMKASKETMITKANANSSSTYWLVFLQEIRAISEASGFAETDSYLTMHIVVIILLMANMFFCIVVLNNILIGQIGNSFNAALADAKVRYDIDRVKLVTRIESPLFCFPWDLRSANYVDGEFLNNSLLEEALMDDWAALKQGSAEKEKRKEDIKGMIGNKLKLS